MFDKVCLAALTIQLLGGSATANPFVEIADYFVTACDDVIADRPADSRQGGLTLVPLNNALGDGSDHSVGLLPKERYILNVVKGTIAGVDKPRILCSVGNSPPGDEEFKNPDENTLGPRDRFLYTDQERADLPNAVHEVLEQKFNSKPFIAMGLAVNGTTHYYEGCLGGREVIVTVQVIGHVWAISAQTSILEQQGCETTA